MKRKQLGAKVGLLLRSARLGAALTLRETEARTGVSNAYLCQIENGFIREPSPFVLKKLSRAYRVSYSRLFDAVGYPRP